MDAKINLDRHGVGTLSVDGIDISHVTSGFTLHANARAQGVGTRLSVDLICPAVTGDLDAAVEISPELSAALVALGWTPPPADEPQDEKEGQ